MPYRTNTDLPPPLREHLPLPAQTVYRETFNHAWDTYKVDPRHEEIAHRVAWAAVKKRYRKQGGAWVPKREGTQQR